MTEEDDGLRRLMRQFTRASAGVLLANAAALPLGFAIHLLLARLLGNVSYGEYSIALTCANLLVIPLCFGLHTGTVRFMPAYSGTGEFGKQAGYLRFSRWASLTLSVLVAVLGALVLLLGDWPISASLRRTLLCLAIQLPALTLFMIYSAFLQSQRRVVSQAVLRGLFRPLGLVAGLALAAALFDIEPMAAFVVLVETLVLLLALAGIGYATRNQPEAAWAAEPVYEVARWSRTSARIVVLESFATLQAWADVLLVGIFLGAAEAGVYAIARRLAQLVGFLLQATIPFVAPAAARLFAEGRLRRLQLLMGASTAIAGLAGLPAAGLLAYLGEPLLELFGPGFAAGHQALTILLIGNVANALAGPVGAVLVMIGEERFCSRVVAATALLNVALNVHLIPKAGLLGAAWASTVCLTAWNLVLLFYLVRILRRPAGKGDPEQCHETT